MPDVLTLGGIQFDDYSTPDSMGAGGTQVLVVHKLPGGMRVIDELGPDEGQITWTGTFFGNRALATALALDAMRASGAVVSLIFAGQFRIVIVQSFTWKVKRLPLWVEYSISCTVVQNPQNGNLAVNNSSAGSLAANDLNAAGNVAGLPQQPVAADPAFTSGTPPVPFGGIGGLGPQ